MKSHIVNELNRRKFPQKIITKLRNQTADLYTGNQPIGQWAFSSRGAKHSNNLHHVNVYIGLQRVCAIRYRAYWTAQVSARLP